MIDPQLLEQGRAEVLLSHARRGAEQPVTRQKILEAIGRDEHDGGSRISHGAEPPRSLESVDPRHADVDEHEVGI